MKIIASAADIAAKIRRRIRESPFANGYCAGCAAPTLFRIKDDRLANWAAENTPTHPRGCEGFVLTIVASVRRDYDLPRQPASEVAEQLFAGRKQPF